MSNYNDLHATIAAQWDDKEVGYTAHDLWLTKANSHINIKLPPPLIIRNGPDVHIMSCSNDPLDSNMLLAQPNAVWVFMAPVIIHHSGKVAYGTLTAPFANTELVLLTEVYQAVDTMNQQIAEFVCTVAARTWAWMLKR